MINWSAYRQLFPHLSDQIYLNHAAISPLNLRARAALETFLDERQGGNIEFFPEVMDRKEQLLEKIALLLNAKKNHLALVPNTSAGLNILALGLNWKKGDRILLNDFEFPSNVIPFTNLQRLGVEVDFVRHRNGILSIEDIEKQIRPRTRLLSISFVEFLNGFKNDLDSLGKICRAKDVIFCVDAIQGLGALRIDVQELGIDFLSTGGHKWLMWPAGMGFVYISPRIFSRLYPAQAGWLSVETPWDFFNYFQDFADGARRFEPGTANSTGIIAASATLDMMLEIGPENIEQKILQNTAYLINRLQETGYRLFTDPRDLHRSGMVSFYHPGAEALFEHFKEQRITVSLREGKIRVAPHFYNNETDLDRFLEVLKNFDKK